MNKQVFPIFMYCLATFFVSQANARDAEPKIEELSWISQSFMSEQRITVDEISRKNFGTPIRGEKSDLQTLQRIVDKQLIDKDDKETLQALGVVLGDVFVKDVKELEWKTLEDHIGRSHVVCVKDTTNCLFPITMLSRRMEVGLKPKVNKIYNDALAEIKPFLPKLPFQK